MEFSHSAKSIEYTTRVTRFIEDNILPVERELTQELSQMNGLDWQRWTVPPKLEALRAEARSLGLWNLFLPDASLSPGLTTVEYASVSEAMGWSLLAPMVFNCNAPDSGNIEVLHRFGSGAQKSLWLEPLLSGRIRSVFCMTEPGVASSDATNIRTTITLDGSTVVINGTKWWSTGLGHPDARVAIVMGHSADDSRDRHHQHTMVLVPLDTPGVTINRMLSVFGDHDPPFGHGEVTFTDVRVSTDNIISGVGQGFEIAQSRLGPGRIHHCMRCVGAAERALSLLLDRATSRTAFGHSLIDLGGNRERIAHARVSIDQARLLTHYAAYKLDQLGPRGAMTEISSIKLVAPSMLQRIVDDAIQLHGGAGLSADTPLAGFFAQARALRLADGPDEVHSAVIARIELSKHRARTRK